MDANTVQIDAAPDEGVKPPVHSADAGTDTSIAERLERNPSSPEARLDRALDESMDASDPPASTQPVHSNSGDLPESSGYDPKAEAKLARAKQHGPIGRLLAKIGLG
ncbi:hypothetical protein [Sphingomonas sp.]|uniref:hypothetical protein n=1 Tax=Sphingomonas sp. TaxID=28214 RepID=UPI0025D9974C|nr:hypothetical protein [Sphingomonas sp.]